MLSRDYNRNQHQHQHPYKLYTSAATTYRCFVHQGPHQGCAQFSHAAVAVELVATPATNRAAVLAVVFSRRQRRRSRLWCCSSGPSCSNPKCQRVKGSTIIQQQPQQQVTASSCLLLGKTHGSGGGRGRHPTAPDGLVTLMSN